MPVEEEDEGIDAVGRVGVLEVKFKYLLFLAFANAVGDPEGDGLSRP